MLIWNQGRSIEAQRKFLISNMLRIFSRETSGIIWKPIRMRVILFERERGLIASFSHSDEKKILILIHELFTGAGE